MHTAITPQKLVMEDATWKRHANPWSVYTRFLSIPLLGAAGWSREWIGWWSVVPIVLVVLFIWINPRLFPPPRSNDNWASKSVLGEQVWLARKSIPIPAHHARAAMILAGVSALGAIQFAYGIVALDEFMVSYGMLLTLIAKAWFLDRMVWLFEDMRMRPEYRSWIY